MEAASPSERRSYLRRTAINRKNAKYTRLMVSRKSTSIYDRIRRILETARTSVARSVNTAQVVANWLIGQEIVEEEQRGKRRAGYGEQLLQDLSARLTAEFGKGFSVDNLELFRRFFLEYSSLLVGIKSDAVRRKSSTAPTEIDYASKREISPLRVGEEVEVLGMACEQECESEMFVRVRCCGRRLAVPLSQLEPWAADSETKEAVADWHYWLGRGYEF